VIDNAHSRIRRLHTDELTPADTDAIRKLLDAAFAGDEHGGFAEDDWQHALGGMHFVLDVDGAIFAHASVVARELHVADVPLRTGYVEAVATAPENQHRGFGTALMRAVNAYIAETYEVGALGTGSHAFYERLGWQTWRGPAYVRTDGGTERTPDEEGYILVLITPSSPPLRLTDAISCEWRPGDVW
jgi:aminoglycoside 2'-N-acetyltransferase I